MGGLNLPYPKKIDEAMPRNMVCGIQVGCCNRPISVYRLGEMPIQTCGQSVSTPRVKAGASFNAHTELRAKRQRSAREAIYRNRPIETSALVRMVSALRTKMWWTAL